MKREFAVCGLGNAIVDIFLDLSEDEFATLNFDRGTMILVDHDQQPALLQKFERSGRSLQLASGGSVANSTIAISQLIKQIIIMPPTMIISWRKNSAILVANVSDI